MIVSMIKIWPINGILLQILILKSRNTKMWYTSNTSSCCLPAVQPWIKCKVLWCPVPSPYFTILEQPMSRRRVFASTTATCALCIFRVLSKPYVLKVLATINTSWQQLCVQNVSEILTKILFSRHFTHSPTKTIPVKISQSMRRSRGDLQSALDIQVSKLNSTQLWSPERKQDTGVVCFQFLL